MALTLALDPADPTPIYAQLERAIRAAIATARLRPGEQLPTVRELAVQLRINANTVARVYTALERDGVFETRRGVGTFVSTTPPKPIPQRYAEWRTSGGSANPSHLSARNFRMSQFSLARQLCWCCSIGFNRLQLRSHSRCCSRFC